MKITHRKSASEGNTLKQEIEIYKEIPDEMKKYYTSGRDTVVISEKETRTYHKVCVMRDDIKEEITKETIEKEIRSISIKSPEGER